MTWLVFSYSFSSGVNSSSRVAVWRKLGRLGAIAPKAGVYVLPDTEEFFESPQALRVRDRINKLEKSFNPSQGQAQQIPKASIVHYKNKRWITRPHPHVDRLACAWLIRRFIDSKAVIRYSNEPKPNEI